MKNILNKGYAIIVEYKDGSVFTKYFNIRQLQKATNYFNRMNNSIDKNVRRVSTRIAHNYKNARTVHKVSTKIAQVSW